MGTTDPGQVNGRGGTRREDAAASDGGGTRREYSEANGSGTRREAVSDHDQRHVFVKLPTNLAERFTIVEEFPTQGNEATVMLVEEIANEELRVIKLYHRGIELRPDAVRKVLDAGTDNAHVVTVSEIDREQGRWYEVQEYCSHGSLATVLARDDGPRIDPTELAAQLIRAVAGLETLGLYHRDLKPQNVLVRQLDPLVVVVTDFGLARDAEAGSQLRTVGGTVAYQPPEAAFDHVSAAYDWFSVGMVIAEVALGHHLLATPEGPLPAAGAIREFLNRHAVDVAGIGDERLQLLLRGLLHRRPENRWRGEQALAWLDEETPDLIPDVDGPATEAAVTGSIRFNGAVHRDPAGLAAAMQESWDPAIRRLFQQRDPEWIEELCSWLEAHDRKDAARCIAERPADAASIPTRFSEFLIELDPDLRPEFDGIRLTAAGLQEEAQAVVGGHGSPKKLDQVRTSGTLRTWTSLPVMGSFPGGKTAAQVHDLWQSYCEKLDEHAEALPRPDDAPTGQAREKARAQLLLCAIDPRYHDQLKRRLVPRRTRAERQVQWWRHLAAQTGTSPSAATLATLLQAPAREAAEAAKPKPSTKPKATKARSPRGTLTLRAQGRWLTVWFSALWTALLVGQLRLIGTYHDELLMFLTRRSNETLEERPHVLNVDDLTLVRDNTHWLVTLAVGFLAFQILGMWLSDEKLPAAVARLWVLGASLVQLITTLAVAACAAFTILLAYVSVMAEEFGYGREYLPGWLWWGWLVGAGMLILALPVAWEALRRFLLALSGGQVTRV